MKTKNLIIGVLTVAVVVLSVMLYQAHNDRGESSHKSAQLDQKESNFFCVENLDPNDGRPITLRDARAAVNEFGRLYPGDSVKAFHVGLKTMHAMMDSIQLYNQQPGVTDPITGIRFYRGITTRNFTSSTGMTMPVKNKHDLVIVPTLLSGYDLHVVLDPDPLFRRNVPIYSYTRPCPKLCGSKYITK
ncbi:hypothetical protein [Fluviicola taffensis]|uniref:hypothetical protein n=1 Tax=Fluviicola taffensis TaxID=191579 RepID=UPI003137E7DB